MSTMGFDRKASRPSLRAPEFQAVILAGYGTGLQPLTNELTRGSGSSPTPKALLPIGNKPMIFYPLSWLQGAAVKDILIISPASHKAEISETIWHSDPLYPSFSSLTITLETLDEAESASMGTADILRKFSGLFQTDIIVLPCDFVPPPSLTLTSILNSYRTDTDRPICQVLLYERGDAVKDGPPLSMFGVDKKTNSLVYVDEEYGSNEDLDLRMSLLWKYPHVTLTSRFLDSHVYILRPPVLDLLAERPNLGSLRDDVLPWLVKLSYRKTHRKNWGISLRLPPDPQYLALAHSTTPYRKDRNILDILGTTTRPATTTNPPLIQRRASVSRSSNPASALTKNAILPEDNLSSLRCGVTLHHLKDGYAARANTIGTYSELNRQALAAAAHSAASAPVQVQNQALMISADSIVARTSRIGERTSIKKSVLGPHCVVGKNVKISGCIIMDHVEVKDGAKLENTILSRNTLVEERGQLKDCELAPGVTTQPDASLKGERLSLWQSY